MRVIIHIFFFTLIPFLCFPQGEFNNWYFGHHCGITFNSGAPILSPGNPMNSGGKLAEASVSDSSGILLFFSNGRKVYNRYKVEMPNGTGLLGGDIESQVMAVQDISNHNLYYLFTVHHRPTNTGPDTILVGAHYSMIDMQLDGGKGDIVPGMKNITLPMGDSVYTQLTATRHQNNRNAWVVFLEHGKVEHYFAFLIDSAGLNLTPVVSQSTLKNSIWAPQSGGGISSYLRISQDGKYLFCTDSLTEMCLFNTSTGVVTPKFRFWPGLGEKCAYDEEFSIDSRYVYFTTNTVPPDGLFGAVVQYDMINTDSSSFMDSRKVVGDSSAERIQMAPDGKIYVNGSFFNFTNSYLHRINNPSDSGTACNYEKRAFDLEGNIHFYSLPKFLQRYKAYLHHSTAQCQNDSIRFSNDIWPPPDSIHWDFGDPVSGAANYSNLLEPSHLYSGPGNFTVEMWVRHIDKRTDTAWAVITIPPSPNPELGNDTTVCTGDSVTFDAGLCITCTYLWRNLVTGLPVGTNQTYTATTTGVYEVAVTDTNDCTGRDTVQFTVTPIPLVTNTPLSKTICSGESTNIVLTSNVTNVNFHWTATLTSGNITGFSADSGLVINQILIDHNTSPGVVTYNITPKAGNCIGIMADYTVTVNPGDSVDVSIVASTNNVCAGTQVTFTATPVNGGTNPAFQWKVNGTTAGTNNPIFTYTPLNNDKVHCVLTSSNTTCTTNNPAISDTITMIVNPNLPVSVTVVASQNPICTGTSVTFTATPTNGGTSPTYEWRVNGINVGTSSPVYTYTPINGDLVWCILSSSEVCTTGNPASSIQLQMIVNENLPVSVSVTASQNPVCAGTSVTFTATPTNGGTLPIYQWKVNGVIVGTNNPVYTYAPVNGDLVWCVLTSSEVCTSSNPSSSIQIQMVVNNNLPASVCVTGSPNPFCPGVTVGYTATPVNGGTSPVYQWKVNGNNIGTNSPMYSYSPIPNDSVWCVMTSNLTCVSGIPATSNKIVMVASPVPVVTFTRCFDSVTTLNAKPIKLKGGIPLGGTYSGPGVNSLTGIFTPSTAGTGTKILTYTYTNVALCSANKATTITVQANPSFTCGNNLLDIRDGKVYPTLQIGSQCWMSANLNYGTMILSSAHQRDNCLPEKYCYNDLAANCLLLTAYYQWDELMQYQETPGLQGLCPPAWHIPTEAEWNTLFSNWWNNAFAGAPLKYSGYSGFDALLSGVRHQNVQWDYRDFATFFWSSTQYNIYKAWSHGMNDYDPSVASYPALRSNAFSVRCLRD
jgi:uncharacterized protein (TIGR02145 family)